VPVLKKAKQLINKKAEYFADSFFKRFYPLKPGVYGLRTTCKIKFHYIVLWVWSCKASKKPGSLFEYDPDFTILG
jgi:hypothetical protein